jgi:arabinofuranosyltransferase
MILSPARPRSQLAGAAALASLAVIAVVILRAAWVSDDAYLTFRTIDNLIHGFGLRWNVAERVQAYTHPLWLLLMTPFAWVTGDVYFTSIAVSMAITLVTLWRLLRVWPLDTTLAPLGLLALLLSRAFIDYSTSGLENPLTHLLLLLFYAECLGRRRLARLAAFTSFLMLNRFDAGLLVLPALAAAAWRANVRDWIRMVAGFLPLFAWEVFSLVYYGFPFPNTAYAKLQTGIPERELLGQGATYFADSIRRDPITLLVIGTALFASVASRRRGVRPLAIGLVTYLTYTAWIGGDFMSGRLFAAPLLGAVMLLLEVEIAPARKWAAAAALTILGFAAQVPTLSPRSELPIDQVVGSSGIADERLYYFAGSGLMNYTRGTPWPNSLGANIGREQKRAGRTVLVNCCNGMAGYFGGPTLYIVDTVGLGDPLLARLPAVSRWRIGHFERDVPAGYEESVAQDQNLLRAPGLAAYYDRLRLITRGPLWTRRRLAAILRINTGGYDAYLTSSRSLARSAGQSSAPQEPAAPGSRGNR